MNDTRAITSRERTREYFAKHDIDRLLEEIVVELTVSKPDNPKRHIHEFLGRSINISEHTPENAFIQGDLCTFRCFAECVSPNGRLENHFSRHCSIEYLKQTTVDSWLGDVNSCLAKLLAEGLDFPTEDGIAKPVIPDEKISSEVHQSFSNLGNAGNFSLPLEDKQRVDEDPKSARIEESSSCACCLRVIFVNDVYELDNLPHFATCVKQYSADSSDCTTIVMLPGDFVAPSLLSQLDNARGMVDCLNRCGMQYVCFGNHETDIPHQELIQRIKESRFKWINSNMRDIDLGDAGALPEYEIVCVEHGGQRRRVAILGLLTDDKALYRPGAFQGASISNVADCADRLARHLEEQEQVDLVLPMTHQVMAHDRAFAAKFATPGAGRPNRFPLIVGGHDHEPYLETVEGACIVKTGSDAKRIAICHLTWPSPSSPRRRHIYICKGNKSRSRTRSMDS